MKKKLFVATLAICVIAAGSLTANAYRGGGIGGCNQAGPSGYQCGENEWCGNQSGKNRQGRVAEELGLSEKTAGPDRDNPRGGKNCHPGPAGQDA